MSPVPHGSWRYALFVDPSIKAMGWALFTAEYTKVASLEDSGVHKQSKDQESKNSLEWVNRVDEMADFILSKVGELNVSFVGIEMPSTYGGATGAAASNSGAIMKLAFAVASLRGALRACDIEVELIPVQRWKGTTPKHITKDRVRRHWNFLCSDHNQTDAVGMGDWYLRQHSKFTPEPLIEQGAA